MNHTTGSPDGTLDLGDRIGRACRGGEVILLHGDLGAGKTHLTKGIGRGLGLDPDPITSPTFTLQAIHTGTPGPRALCLYHVDLYRIESPAELATLDLFEEAAGPGVTVIEWPDRGGGYVPRDALDIAILDGDVAACRRLTVTLRGRGPAHLLDALAATPSHLP